LLALRRRAGPAVAGRPAAAPSGLLGVEEGCHRRGVVVLLLEELQRAAQVGLGLVVVGWNSDRSTLLLL